MESSAPGRSLPLRFFPLLRVVPHEQTQSEQASVIEEKYSALSKMYDAWIARTWTLSRSISSFFPTIRSLWIPLFAIALQAAPMFLGSSGRDKTITILSKFIKFAG